MKKKIGIAGGGLAGLSCAVFLADRGYDVNLFEASPKLGGRVYSYFDRDKKMFFDNGQHILAGWYKNTFDYLKLIGSFGKLNFQEKFAVDYLEPGGNYERLSSTALGPPFGLLTGLLKFRKFSTGEKLSLFKLRGLTERDNAGQFDNAGQMLESFGQSGNLMKYFWEPLILAAFNTTPEKADPVILSNVLSEALDCRDGFKLVTPNEDLSSIFVAPAQKFLESKGCAVQTGVRVTGKKNGRGLCALQMQDSNSAGNFDFAVSAVPAYAYAGSFGEVFAAGSEDFRTSSIVSVHLFIKDDELPVELPENPIGMTGLIGTRTQWIFRKSKQHLSLVISGADEFKITELSNEQIFEICVSDMKKCVTGFDKSFVEDYKVIREKKATFIPDKSSSKARPGSRTDVNNFFIAGDWTDTGLPSTIEGAVKSGRICAELIEKSADRI